MLICIICTDCGGEMTTPGLIKSPVIMKNFEKIYPDNLNCTWIIRAPSKQIIQLVYVSRQYFIFILLF